MIHNPPPSRCECGRMWYDPPNAGDRCNVTHLRAPISLTGVKKGDVIFVRNGDGFVVDSAHCGMPTASGHGWSPSGYSQAVCGPGDLMRGPPELDAMRLERCPTKPDAYDAWLAALGGESWENNDRARAAWRAGM